MAQLNDLLILGKSVLSGDLKVNSKIIQGSPSTDSTVLNMNRLQSDLYVSGDGSAPNSPKVPGFYLGKSTSDENRHMDIVSGADYSYIDFNKASDVEDFKVRLIANVSNGLTEFNWGPGATDPRLNINGTISFPNGARIKAIDDSGSYGCLRIYGGPKGGYEGIHFGSDTSGLSIMSASGTDAHQGLYNESKGRWILYYNKNSNLISIGTATVRDGYINMGGNIYSEGNIFINNGGHGGIGLYNTSSPNTYGIHMSLTSSYSTYGQVTGDWATYFAFDGAVNRGWIFKHANTNVFSINGNGTLSIRENVPGIFFRPGHGEYDANISYQTSGNEAMVFTTKNAVTSFMFVNGEDTITNISSSRWNSLTPGLQIKNNCVAIGKRIADAETPGYKLEVSGGTAKFNGVVFGYNYTNSSNAAAFIWDKPGSNYTGVGCNGSADTIQFGACTVAGAWVDYAQKWLFKGEVTATKVYGAVWNDYAEYRTTLQDIEPGRVVIENGDGSLEISTKRLQAGGNIISDTFGFAIGETENCKTPLAVSGRVLAYPYEDRYSYKPGDAVGTGPSGTVSKMSREEIREYPERIIGTVSEIPNYEVWGSGNIKVNNRIWIKVK